MRLLPDRLPRTLHPGAWWIWALGLAAAASRTTNPALLLAIVASCAIVVHQRRTDAAWGRAFVIFLRLGLVVIAFRTIAQVVLGVSPPGTTIVVLPSIDLPSWAAGIALGGPITNTGLAAGLVDGLRLATILACVGAANALANPKRLIARLPAALYEVGVAAIVAFSFAPQLATAVNRVRAARRLRGYPDRGVRSMLTVAKPVLEAALDRSLALAAAMDSRGYGRQREVTVALQRWTAVLMATGLGGMAVGVFGILDGAGSVNAGLIMMALGCSAGVIGLALAGKRAIRTQYRPEPWGPAELLTAATGVAALAASVAAALIDPGALLPSILPLSALPLPLVALSGIIVAAVPAWLTPPPLALTGEVRSSVATSIATAKDLA